MGRIHSPRRGSMAYSPRKRAKRIYPRVRSWPIIKEQKLLGFAGYKAGMTHMFLMDSSKETATAGKEIFTPVTVLDCPPIFPFSIRFYSKTGSGLKVVSQTWCDAKLSKDLNKKIVLPKKAKQTPSQAPSDFDEISVLVHAMPRESSADHKSPEIMEIAIGGSSKDEKLNYAKEILGKELKASDLFKEGDFVDVTAVTKGKGVQGPVKRFGVAIQRAKAQRSGKGRHVGSIGGRGTATRWTVPQAGQMGYHTRTDFNKKIIKVGTKGEEITPKGGFVNYGVVKNDFVVLKGSVPGPTKRLIRLRPALRPHPAAEPPQVTYVSLESKQGK